MDRSSRTQAQRGFTLIEVLVALAIIAIGLGAVIYTVGAAARTSAGLQARTYAAWVAQNRLATLRLNRVIPSQGSRATGRAKMGGERFYWVQSARGASVPGMTEVSISVAAKRGASPLVTLRGYFR